MDLRKLAEDTGLTVRDIERALEGKKIISDEQWSLIWKYLEDLKKSG